MVHPPYMNLFLAYQSTVCELLDSWQCEVLDEAGSQILEVYYEYVTDEVVFTDPQVQAHQKYLESIIQIEVFRSRPYSEDTDSFHFIGQLWFN